MVQGVGLQGVQAYDSQCAQSSMSAHYDDKEACNPQQHANVQTARPNHSLHGSSRSGTIAASSSAGDDHIYPIQMDSPQSDSSQSNSNTPREREASSRIDPNITTLVVRNIPARYTKEELLQEWPPDGGFDFLYLPFNQKQKRTAGYCFVNFTSSEAAVAFYCQWHGKWLHTSKRATKKLSVAAAEVQGLEANLQHLVHCGIQRIKNTKYLPSVFNGDREMPFNEETSAGILLALRSNGPLFQNVAQ